MTFTLLAWQERKPERKENPLLAHKHQEWAGTTPLEVRAVFTHSRTQPAALPINSHCTVPIPNPTGTYSPHSAPAPWESSALPSPSLLESAWKPSFATQKLSLIPITSKGRSWPGLCNVPSSGCCSSHGSESRAALLHGHSEPTCRADRTSATQHQDAPWADGTFSFILGQRSVSLEEVKQHYTNARGICCHSDQPHGCVIRGSANLQSAQPPPDRTHVCRCRSLCQQGSTLTFQHARHEHRLCKVFYQVCT